MPLLLNNIKGPSTITKFLYTPENSAENVSWKVYYRPFIEIAQMRPSGKMEVHCAWKPWSSEIIYQRQALSAFLQLYNLNSCCGRPAAAQLYMRAGRSGRWQSSWPIYHRSPIAKCIKNNQSKYEPRNNGSILYGWGISDVMPAPVMGIGVRLFT